MAETKSISPQPQASPAAAATLPALAPSEVLSNDYYKEALQRLPIQRKLTIGAVDDPLEREADEMAATIMRMPDTNFIQRKCAACEHEEELQRKPLSKTITPFIQAKQESTSIVSDATASKINATRGAGSNMESSTQSFMESRFGTDFSGVSIHTGDDAVQLSRELNAQAFTVGSDIYFNSGKYTPESEGGKHLLAHELTHTIQQGASSKSIQRACGNKEIGTPAGCISTSVNVPERPRYLFDVNCNTFMTGNELDLRADSALIQDGEVVEVHGLASEEGDVDYNIRLSCARALRAREVIEDVLLSRGISATIRVYNHGPQFGGDYTVSRSVVVIRHPIVPPPDHDDPDPDPAPPTVPICSGIYTDGNDETADGDHDLDQAHHSGERSPDIVLYDYIGGENGAWLDYYTGYFGGTMFESTTDDDDLYNHFMTGSGSRLTFGTSTDMASIIERSPTFTTFATSFESTVLSHISSTGTLCGFDGNAYLASHRPAYFHSPLFAWAVMGGYARIDAHVIQTPTGGISITYIIYDHYGAGVSDAWSYLLGLSAMYYLQHFHGSPGTNYTPYIWSVRIGRTSP